MSIAFFSSYICNYAFAIYSDDEFICHWQNYNIPIRLVTIVLYNSHIFIPRSICNWIYYFKDTSLMSTSSFLYDTSYDANSSSIEVFIVAWMIGFAYWMGFYWLNKSWVFMLDSAFISRYINFLKNFLKECVYAWRDEACSFPHNSCFTICFYNI